MIISQKHIDHVYKVSLTISHPLLPDPIDHKSIYRSGSLCALIKLLKVSGKQACDLKKYGSTSWTDDKGGMHTLCVNEELSL